MILVTGFEPFGDIDHNPSEQVVRALEADPPPAGELRLEVLPVVTGAAGDRVVELAVECDARAVLMLGEARGRAEVLVESVAVNLRDFRMADNEGNTAIEQPVVADGPDGLFSTFAAARLVEAVRTVGVPASRSFSAGTYLCNEISYRMLHHLAATGRNDVPAGFVHLPSLPAQVESMPEGTPSMPLDRQVAAVRAILDRLMTGLDRG